MDGVLKIKIPSKATNKNKSLQSQTRVVVVDSGGEILFNEAHLVYVPLHHHPPLLWDGNENVRETKEELLGFFFFSSECFVAV